MGTKIRDFCFDVIVPIGVIMWLALILTPTGLNVLERIVERLDKINL